MCAQLVLFCFGFGSVCTFVRERTKASAHGGQQKFWSQFSPSAFVLLSGTELRSGDAHGEHLYL